MTPETKATTIAQLAKVFEVSCGTVKAYLAEGMPGKSAAGYYSVEKCLEWIQLNKNSKVKLQERPTGLPMPPSPEDRSQWNKGMWQREQLRLKCRDMELEFQKKWGEVLEKQKVINDLKAVREAEKQALYAIGPQVASFFGEEGPKIEQKITEAITGILSRLHGGELYGNNGT